jgi:type I restriction enzyme S subunit
MPLPERPLGEAIRLVSDSVIVEPDQDYRIAGIYSFGRGLIKRPTINGTETSYKTLTRLCPGRLVMSKLNAREGALAVVPDEFSGANVSPEYPVFEINTDIAEPAYISHLIKWPALWERLTPRGSMARRKRTTPSTLMATKVPLPELDEQRRIAARLESASNTLSLIREKRTHSSYLRKSLRESLYQSEEASNRIRLSEILTFGRAPIEIEPDRDYTQIGVRSFGNGIFHREKMPGIELSKLKYFEVRAGRLIVSNIMAREGAIAVSADADQNCIASSRFLSFTPSSDVNLEYLNYYFQTQRGRELIRSASTGTVLRNQTLSVKNFERITLPLPSLKRQQRVVSLLHGSAHSKSLAEDQESIDSALRRSLLETVFNGQL